ncbi:MAG: TrkH family potassium uptake protein [Lachnospiraceae bacterium]|nr:TrkH family potassium uptake protein [Lachnospiraceae bacterium]
MNFGIVRFVLGWILQFEGIFLILPAITAAVYKEWREVIAFIATALASLLIGYLMRFKRPKDMSLYTREGFASVALGWFVMSLVGAVPFVATGDIPNYIDALFETISGLTTTGASILTDVEVVSHGGLFWRSFTHWIGGMGVFVFIMAIVPLAGGSTMNLMRAESPGPSVGKLVPRVKDTAKALYVIYLGITGIEVVTLLICGMNLFESLTLTFGTVGTGGFGVSNASIGGYSHTVQVVITVFMILSGINYTFFFAMIHRQFKQAFAIEEVRWYLAIIFGSVLIIFINIKNMYTLASDALRDAFFQVGSIITTTGFSTTDFDTWPQLSKTIIVLLMIIGACAGSTGGGFKISRILILLKAIKKELLMMIHPNMIKKLRLDGRVIPHETIRSTNVFMSIYIVILFGSTLLVSFDEFGFTTNFTAVLACLNNIGPGLDLVGPARNFAFFSPFVKIILMFDMLAGRLELLPMLILLVPQCWKKY